MLPEYFDRIPRCFWPIVETAKPVQKIWGWEFWLENSTQYGAKLLLIEPQKQCSLHYHEKKTETFLVVSGTVLFQELDVRRRATTSTLIPGDKRRIVTGTPHRFGSEFGALILEFSTHHSDQDVVRLQESGPLSNELINSARETV